MFKTVKRKIGVNSGCEEVWSLMTSPGKLENYHPFCRSNEVLKWDAENSVDLIKYYNGKILKRSFYDWNDKCGYRLIINDMRKDIADVRWKILTSDSDTTNLSIEIRILDGALLSYPRIINRILLTFYVLPLLGSYLESVLKGFKYFSETGSSVSKNQFGNNPLFSNK